MQWLCIWGGAQRGELCKGSRIRCHTPTFLVIIVFTLSFDRLLLLNTLMQKCHATIIQLYGAHRPYCLPHAAQFKALESGQEECLMVRWIRCFGREE